MSYWKQMGICLAVIVGGGLFICNGLGPRLFPASRTPQPQNIVIVVQASPQMTREQEVRDAVAVATLALSMKQTQELHIIRTLLVEQMNLDMQLMMMMQGPQQPCRPLDLQNTSCSHPCESDEECFGGWQNLPTDPQMICY